MRDFLQGIFVGEEKYVKISRIIIFLGQIHLHHLQICKYFMDDSSVNFHDKFFSEF